MREKLSHFTQDKNTVLHYCPLCTGNPPITGGFPVQRVNNAVCPQHYIIMTKTCSLSDASQQPKAMKNERFCVNFAPYNTSHIFFYTSQGFGTLSAEQNYIFLTAFYMHFQKKVDDLMWISRVSCQKGPICHAYAWQIGPFWQDTLDMFLLDWPLAIRH